MNIIDKRISALRELMRKNKIDFYLVPTSDYHQSEFVSEYFKSREFITGFTGSAGTALIGLEDAYLWTDGRYFIQAEKELSNSKIKLMKSGEKNVPSLESFLRNILSKNMTLAFDGRLISCKKGLNFLEIAENNAASIKSDMELINEIWNGRPSFPFSEAYKHELLEEAYPSDYKLLLVRESMQSLNADYHILSSIDDICWILNIRGNDISYSPLVLCFALITADKFYLYIDENKICDELKLKLKIQGIEIKEYEQIYRDISSIDNSLSVLLDSNRINFALFASLPDEIKIIDELNPSTVLKSIKNDKEIENIKIAQLKDSIAHVRFMKWLKENKEKTELTELSVIEKLESIRKSMGAYMEPSFEPISSACSHAAIIHYSPTCESNLKLEENNVLLMDTGAHYVEGTTDITRTYAIGDLPHEIKEDFTLVAISHLSLANAVFPQGCNGVNLDTFARKPFWDRHINFRHGTGHGIGNLLSVHESPIGIRWRYVEGETEDFKPGMIVTDEPGIYIEGSHGIRLENELLVVKDIENEYGTFLKFEILTLIPFDLDAIIPEMMSAEERKMLNEYHRNVFIKLKPHLDKDEVCWLAHYTRAI